MRRLSWPSIGAPADFLAGAGAWLAQFLKSNFRFVSLPALLKLSKPSYFAVPLMPARIELTAGLRSSEKYCLIKPPSILPLMLKLGFAVVEDALVMLMAPPKKLAVTFSNSGLSSVIRILPLRLSRGGKLPHWARLPERSNFASIWVSALPDSGMPKPRFKLVKPETFRFFFRPSWFLPTGEAKRYWSICCASPWALPLTESINCLALTLGISAWTLLTTTLW